MVKIFTKDEHGGFFIAEWETGYIQFWEEWSQFLHPKNYNWINLRPIYFEIEYDKTANERVCIELGLAGFNLRFQQHIRDNEKGREIDIMVDEIKTIDEAHKEEVKKLKREIRRLKAKFK